MSTQIEKTIPSLARPTAKSVPIVLAAAVVLSLVAGLLASVYYQAWMAVAVLFIGIAALLALLVLQFGELLRFAAGKQSEFAWTVISPDVQRQTLNTEIEQIAKQLQIEGNERSELLSTYIVAQDLALRQVQQEYKAVMARHAAIDRVSFDALIPEANRVTCVESIFLIAPELPQDKIDAMLKKIARVSKAFDAGKVGLDLRLLIVLVIQLDSAGETTLKASLKQRRFASTAADIDIRIFDFEELQSSFFSD
jgi:hypothetical protein